MERQARARNDFVPHLPDLLVAMGACWRSIRDAQTEVDPFGPNYAALDAVRTDIEALAHRLTGERDFYNLVGPGGEAPPPQRGRGRAQDAEPF